MKFSICLTVAALTMSAGAYAQTSQTFRFGEGQSSMQSGDAHSAPAPHAQQPQAGEHTAPKAKSKHTTRHHSHHGHVTQPDTFSHN